MMTELRITGMTCGHCVASVTKALEAVPGVESAEVSLAAGRASVRGTAEVPVLIGAVEEEGYAAADADAGAASAERGESVSYSQVGGNARGEK